jgi:hypothetical protein
MTAPMHLWQELLLFLYRDGRKWLTEISRTDWRRGVIPEHGLVPELRIQMIHDEAGLVAHLGRESAPSDVGPKKAIVLRPSPHDENALSLLVPFILEVGSDAKISLQLGMYAIRSGQKTFFGYRFEGPEIGDEHSFHHAQPITSFGHGGAVAAAIGWHPDRCPSFPLSANNQEELVVTLLVSTTKWSRLRALSTSTKISNAARAVVGSVMQRIRPPITKIRASDKA